MAGLGVLLRKELLESWRTYRLAVVGGLFLFVGLSSPLLAKFLPEILKAAGGDQFGVIVVPTPTAADAVDQLWKNLAQFGAFAAIILAMGAVSTEKDRGTAAFVLSKTASRGAFLGAKVVGDRAPSWGWRRSWPSPSAGSTPRSCSSRRRSPAGSRMGVLAWLGLGAWAAITFLGSTVTGLDGRGGRASASWRCSSCRSSRRSRRSARTTPGGLAAPAIALATGVPSMRGDVLIPVVSTLVLIGLALAASAWSFRRQEL